MENEEFEIQENFSLTFFILQSGIFVLN